MEKNSLRTLKERYDSEYEERQNLHAKFLKRKRVESHRTLEEVSKGICSPSYLSKIENAQVDVDEFYFKALFEKLDIVYEDFKNQRQEKIYNTFFQYYLSHQYLEMEKLTNTAIKTKAYCDTEIELMILFTNIVTKKFEEAKMLINKIEVIRNALSNEELLVFVYLTTLYCLKTYQTPRAEMQLGILLNIKYENEIIRLAVYDVAIDVYSLLGQNSNIYKYYYLLERSNMTEIIVKRLMYHRFKMLAMSERNQVLEALEEFKQLSKRISGDVILENEYQYYLAFFYYRLEMNDEALDIIKKAPIDARYQALLASIMLKFHDYRKEADYLPLLSRYVFTKYETIFEHFVEYVRQKLEQYSYLRLLSYLKNVVLADYKVQYASFLVKNAVDEYLKIGYECGKYKETLKYAMQIILKG